MRKVVDKWYLQHSFCITTTPDTATNSSTQQESNPCFSWEDLSSQSPTQPAVFSFQLCCKSSWYQTAVENPLTVGQLWLVETKLQFDLQWLSLFFFLHLCFCRGGGLVRIWHETDSHKHTLTHGSRLDTLACTHITQNTFLAHILNPVTDEDRK